MSTISVRTIGVNYEPQEGNGLSDFIYDIDAIAQIIGTTLRLLQAEWWENTQAGTPVFQTLLGQGNASNTQVLSTILQNRIYSVPYVEDITNLVCTYVPQTRALTFSATVLTQFGTIIVTSGNNN